MKKEYINRYGDHIWFEKIDEHTVEMTGYAEHWLRIGYANDWSEAYEVYCIGNENPMNFVDFVHEMETNYSVNEHPLRFYRKYCKTDLENLNMVDPSGGPYIALGTDIGRYFEDGKERRVQSIKLSDKKAIFYV